METVLITGATGTIGGQLIPLLLAEGYNIRILTRNKSKSSIMSSVFEWDIDKGYIEEGALDNVDHIIHLAGASVSKRWTDKTRQSILDSRIKAAELIYQKLEHRLKSFISASGISYYGTVTVDKIFTEKDKINYANDDFLADVTHKWEKAAEQFESKSDRVIKMRTPVVLSKTGGALERIVKPIKMHIGSPLGNGKQWMPWAHVNDLCRAYLHILKHSELRGAFNVSAPEHINNKQLTKQIAKTLRRKILLPKVPGFVLKLLFGEMADIILKGSRIDGTKITQSGFDYKYKELKKALADLL
jgi:uncharacterized protein (TIGR01777 family)